MFKKNNTNYIFILALLLIIIIQGNKIRKNQTEPPISNSLVETADYIKRVQVGGDKRVVILGNGPVFNNNGDVVAFHKKAIIDPLRNKLHDEGYTVISIGLPCLEPECYSKFFSLANAIVEMKPEAVVFHSVSTGLNTDTLDKFFREANISVFTFGRFLNIDFITHVGPDNILLGKNLAEGLKNEIREGDKILYVETVRLINGDVNDNGFPRIDAARRLFNSYGVEEVKTISTFWSKTTTYEEVLKILKTNKEIDYILTPSQETAEGAINAVKELKLQDDVKILCMDFNPTIRKLIESGEIYATVGQQFYKQSSTLLTDILKNDDIEDTEVKKQFASEIITRENLDNFRNESGDFLY